MRQFEQTNNSRTHVCQGRTAVPESFGYGPCGDVNRTGRVFERMITKCVHDCYEVNAINELRLYTP